MAGINLRYETDADGELLTALAQAQGLSKNAAALRAIREAAARAAQQREVRELAQRIIAEDKPLLDRLADA